MWSPQLAGRACADHFLCGTFLSAAQGAGLRPRRHRAPRWEFHVTSVWGVGHGPPELLPLSFSLIVLSPVQGGGGSLMNKLSRFCCQSPPRPPSLSQQRMLGKEGGVRRCELWERTASKKNTKLTWDHVTPPPHLPHVMDGATPRETSEPPGRSRWRLALKPVPLRPGTPWSSPAHDLTRPQEADAGTYAPPPR